jgi:predicted HAD superfamily hydrolase
MSASTQSVLHVEGSTQSTCLDKFLKAMNLAALLTFDVFDTVLARNVLVPHHVHVEIGRRLKAAGIRSGVFYKRARLRAEGDANRARGATAKLGEIHDLLAARPGWTEDQRERAGDVELEVERAERLRLPHGAALLTCARQAGKFAGFISDMYLPSAFIRNLLDQAGLWDERDRLWVSCEAGASKADGALFRKVQSEAGIEYGDWLHLGDNPKGDGKAPESLGIMTYLLPSPCLPARAIKVNLGTMLRRRTPMVGSLCAAIERAVRNRHAPP